MASNIFLLFGNPENRFWITIILVIIGVLAFLANKITRGYTIGYAYSSIGEGPIRTIMTIHGLVSLGIALILPNNVLIHFAYVKELFNENELWIAASMLLLLFICLILFGAGLTIAVKEFEKYCFNDKAN